MGKLKGAADGVPFKKNDPRINRQGRPPKLPELENLLAEVLGAEVNNRSAMKMILAALCKKAQKGDVRAAEILMDRAYGKLKTPSEIDLTAKIEALSDEQLITLFNHYLKPMNDAKG